MKTMWGEMLKNDKDEDEDEDENENEDEDEDEDDSKDALCEEEDHNEATVDESMYNEEEAKDNYYHVAKTATEKWGISYKKLSASDENFADRVALLLKYDMEFGSPTPGRNYFTQNNVRIGDWLHEQCNKYKDGRFSESRVRTLNGLDFQF
jgi:hypothetical protein